MTIHSFRKLFWWLRGSFMSLFVTSKYKIRRGYIHKKHVKHFDDSKNEDEWQEEVYQKAKDIFDEKQFSSIIDFGCGSGYKLMKHFGDASSIGFEIEPTLSFLRKKYQHKKWQKFDAGKNYTCDIIIMSDVIEHLENPTQVMDELLQAIDFKIILISTPDRSLLPGWRPFGPSRNISHYREWNFNEFALYLSEFINIREHLITNVEQSNQLVIGSPINK